MHGDLLTAVALEAVAVGLHGAQVLGEDELLAVGEVLLVGACTRVLEGSRHYC